MTSHRLSVGAWHGSISSIDIAWCAKGEQQFYRTEYSSIEWAKDKITLSRRFSTLQRVNKRVYDLIEPSFSADFSGSAVVMALCIGWIWWQWIGWHCRCFSSAVLHGAGDWLGEYPGGYFVAFPITSTDRSAEWLPGLPSFDAMGWREEKWIKLNSERFDALFNEWKVL